MSQFSEEDIYLQVAEELKNAPRPGLLSKCMALCDGEEKKAHAMYQRERVDEIKKEFGFIKSEMEKLGKQVVRIDLSNAQKSVDEKENELLEAKEGIFDGRNGFLFWVACVIIVGWVFAQFDFSIKKLFDFFF